jgi:predicted nucleic acid-binding protein
MNVVSNSTPLIALSRIHKFSLLKEYFGAVFIPKEVYEEVVTRGGDLFGAEKVASAEWIKVEDVKNRIAVDSLSIALDKGEAEAIVLAKEKDGMLIIDEGDGRRTAESLGLKITGTVGILLLASLDGKLNFKSALDELIAVGFRLSEKEYKRILHLEKSLHRKGA